VRNPPAAQHLATFGVSLVKGDLNDTAALDALVANATAVVHGAGAVRGACQADFDAVNVSGTENLLRAVAANAPDARLLLLSSLTAREPQLSWYGQSKADSEKLLADYPALDWVVLRPPAVYGPGDKEMLPVFQAMARGLATVPGSPDARASLIHVCDLVEAIIACLRSQQCRAQTLYLHDGQDGGYNWREMADIAGQVWQRRVRLWRVPRWLLDAVAKVNLALARRTGRAPMLTPAKLRELRHPDWTVDNDRISALTGWQPVIKLRQGLELLENSTV
jgi:nucleoside-diphosphate-sugar epimerase